MEDHLDYPVVGQKTRVGFGCYGANGCDTEWSVEVAVEVIVTLA